MVEKRELENRGKIGDYGKNRGEIDETEAKIGALTQHFFPANSKFRPFLIRSKCFCAIWLKK